MVHSRLTTAALIRNGVGHVGIRIGGACICAYPQGNNVNTQQGLQAAAQNRTSRQPRKHQPARLHCTSHHKELIAAGKQVLLKT